MKYIHIPKVYSALKVFNRQNNALTPSGSITNALAAKGILLTPEMQGARNQLSISMVVSPDAAGEFIRLFASSNSSANTIDNNLIFSTSQVASSTALGFSTLNTRNVSGKSTISLSNFTGTYEWVSMLVTIDSTPSPKTCSLYVNGSLFGTMTASITTPDLRNYMPCYFFSDFMGSIRSFQIWGSSFNASEANSLYSQIYTNGESYLTTAFPTKQLHYNFVFESDKINQGTNEVDLALNDWTAVFDPAVSNISGTSNNTTTISGISNTSSIKVGMNITGTGVPAYARVTTVSTNSIVISSATTVSGAITMNFTPRNVWRFGTAITVGGNGTLYISNDNGTSAGYLDSMISYAYKDVSVSSTASVLSVRCFLPRDGSLPTSDNFKVLVSNTSFIPQNNTAYAPSLSKTSGSYYGNAAILRQTSAYASGTLGGHGESTDYKTINIDLSEYEGQNVRIILCCTTDSSLNGVTGTGGPVAILSAKMKEKNTIQGIKNTYTQLISNGDFESGLSWNTANQTNAWVVGTADKFSGTKALYISRDAGATAEYNISAASISHAWIDLSITSSNPIISFKVKVGGESTTDFLRIRVLDASSAGTPTAGNQVVTGSVAHDATINLTGGWKNYHIDMTGTVIFPYPARLLLTWVNDASVGTQPAAVVDLVSVSGSTLISSEAITVPMIFDDIEFTDNY
jgi:hypothetical protein